MRQLATICNENGFTLLEALVTIVVVSIGMLGLLGLQTVSIANTQTSAARSQATIAADNIADRLRANPDGAQAKNYVYTPSTSRPPAAPSKKCVSSTVCSASEMAKYDTWQWDKGLSERLPNGRGFLACTESVGSSCRAWTVTVVWSEQDKESQKLTGTVPDQCSARSDITERCFQTVVRP